MKQQEPKARRHGYKWVIIALTTFVVITAGVIGWHRLAMQEEGLEAVESELEEASRIYAIEAEFPVEISTLTKVVEAELTELPEGAVEGKLLEYASDTDHILVMAYRFEDVALASESFEALKEEDTRIDAGFFELEPGFYCAVISDVLFLASGEPAQVVEVVNELAAILSGSDIEGSLVTSGKSPAPSSMPQSTDTAVDEPKKEAATVAPTVVESSTGNIAAFAENWWWSKERHQNGRYGETRVSLDLGGGTITRATLFLTAAYSQQAGSASGIVFISTAQQVQPTDAEHDYDNYWYGNTITAGTQAGRFTCSYDGSTYSFDITDFLNNNSGARTLYVAVENESTADIGVSAIFVQVEVVP